MPIDIVTFKPELAGAFAALNREWIERFFVIEQADLKVLLDPKRAIVDRGGEIFFALDGIEAIGTAAAVRTSPTMFELSKMAVQPSHQGQGIGERLGQAVIEFARRASAELVFLETNSKLTAAIRLYERLGFGHVTPPTPSVYTRANVYMELRLGDRP